jgi:hypothetical protein
MTSLSSVAELGSLLTAAQVARQTGLCRESVNLAAREGRLEAALVLPGPNGARLFTTDAVAAWRPQPERQAGL